MTDETTNGLESAEAQAKENEEIAAEERERLEAEQQGGYDGFFPGETHLHEFDGL